jgi:hypothetical protein
MKEKDSKVRDDLMDQKVIDLETGRDITGEYIGRRLKELEELADNIILSAKNECKGKNLEETKLMYEKTYWEIHEKLGMGSIGPATAAAGPLMYEKLDQLAEELGIPEEERIE